MDAPNNESLRHLGPKVKKLENLLKGIPYSLVPLDILSMMLNSFDYYYPPDIGGDVFRGRKLASTPKLPVSVPEC